MPPIHACACFNRRTITRTASQSRLLSLGSCISADVTVLSGRTTLPSSIFSCRALASSVRLIASQVSARIALIVLCSTDFLGLQGHGSRANARNDAESSRPSSARSRSRVGRTDQIRWLGQCVLGALSAPAVAGHFCLSNRKSTRHCRSPPAQKRRFHRCSKTLAFVDGN